MAVPAGHSDAIAGEKHWFPPAGMPLGAAFFVRSDFPWLHHYLDLPRLHSIASPHARGTVAWGGRIAAKSASAISRLRNLPHWRIEDGFLRSFGLGKAGEVPLSIVADDLGLPVDARQASRLERLIAEATGDDASSGADIRQAIVTHKLSKYNHLPHSEPRLPRSSRRRVLLIDQVAGDVSVPRALGSAASFLRMLDDAVASGAQCIVRTHPDVMAGYRKGYLAEAAAKKPDITLFAEPVSAAAMLAAVDEVWTVSSQFGLDALLRGIPVRCYAAPFYAGWGLTDDRMSGEAKRLIGERRNIGRTIDDLAVAAFERYPLYRNPDGWGRIDVFRAIDLIVGKQRATA